MDTVARDLQWSEKLQVAKIWRKGTALSLFFISNKREKMPKESDKKE
jgi:hypothetical protein